MNNFARTVVRSISGSLTALLCLSPIIGCQKESNFPEDLSTSSDYEACLQALIDERRKLKDALETGAADLSPDPICVLTLNGAFPSVYENAYPLISENGWVASVVLSDGKLPGESGMMSISQAKELCEKGWDLALGDHSQIPAVLTVDGEEQINDEWVTYLTQTLEKIKNLGLPSPIAYCFDNDNYNPMAESILTEKGIRIVRHQWSKETIQKQKFAEYSLEMYGRDFLSSSPYRIGSAVICSGTSTAQLNVLTACQQNAVISVYTGEVLSSVPSAQQSVNCTEAKYRKMLTDLDRYTQSDHIRILSFHQLADYKTEFEETLETNRAEYQRLKSEYNARIVELESEIARLMRTSLTEN